MVRTYCAKKGLRVMMARIIVNKFCEDVVGCRMTVPIRQTDEMLGNRIWPDEMICRRWRKSRSFTRNNDRHNGNYNTRTQRPTYHNDNREQESGGGHTREDYFDYDDDVRRPDRDEYDRDQHYTGRDQWRHDDQARDSTDLRSRGSLTWRNDDHGREHQFRDDDYHNRG